MKAFVSYELRGENGVPLEDGNAFANLKAFTQGGISKAIEEVKAMALLNYRMRTKFTGQLAFTILCLVKIDDPPRPGTNGIH